MNFIRYAIWVFVLLMAAFVSCLRCVARPEPVAEEIKVEIPAPEEWEGGYLIDCPPIPNSAVRCCGYGFTIGFHPPDLCFHVACQANRYSPWNYVDTFCPPLVEKQECQSDSTNSDPYNERG